MGLFRYLLAAAVVWTHAHNPSYPGLLNAGMAVTSFFMISGFYMGLILETKYGSNIRVFYLSRFLRIYPLYYLTLVFALSLLAVASLWQGNWADRLAFYAYAWETGHGFLVFLLILVQTFLVGIDLPCLFSYTESGPRLLPLGGPFDGILLERMLVLPQAWTIGFEVLFYLLVPWIRRWKTKALLQVAAFSFALKIILRILSSDGESSKWEYQFFPPQCVFFLLGFLAYRHRDWISRKMPSVPFIMGLLVLLGMFFTWPYLPIVGTDFLWWGLVFFALPGIFQATRSSPVDSFLGSLSYPLYLIHIPIRWLLLGPGGSYGAALSPILLLVISTLISVGLALFFESRLESWRARVIQKLLSLQRQTN
jgi:peptidoglycan/LPS O-acetylase OafA/YrhL